MRGGEPALLLMVDGIGRTGDFGTKLLLNNEVDPPVDAVNGMLSLHQAEQPMQDAVPGLQVSLQKMSASAALSMQSWYQVELASLRLSA